MSFLKKNKLLSSYSLNGGSSQDCTSEVGIKYSRSAVYMKFNGGPRTDP